MPSVEFDSLLAEDYVLARRVITMLGSRVRYLGDRLSNLATGSVMSRLIKLLISLVYDLLPDAEAWAKPVALPVRISQEQLASMTGSTQPTVSDLLQKLHKAGLIAIAHRQITICNPLHLLAHAEEIIEDCTPLERDGRVPSCITIGLEKGAAIPTSSVHLPFSLSVGFLCDGCGKDDESLQSNMAITTQQVHDFCITTIVTLRKWPILST